jgi:hypothetical protein
VEEVLVVVGTSVVAAVVVVTLVAAVLVVGTSAALAVPVLAVEDFAQPRMGMGALILPVEVSTNQLVHSDTTTEAAARLLLGHTNSADGETNRLNRMPAGTQPLLASRIARHH